MSWAATAGAVPSVRPQLQRAAERKKKEKNLSSGTGPVEEFYSKESVGNFCCCDCFFFFLHTLLAVRAGGSASTSTSGRASQPRWAGWINWSPLATIAFHFWLIHCLNVKYWSARERLSINLLQKRKDFILYFISLAYFSFSFYILHYWRDVNKRYCNSLAHIVVLTKKSPLNFELWKDDHQNGEKGHFSLAGAASMWFSWHEPGSKGYHRGTSVILVQACHILTKSESESSQ